MYNNIWHRKYRNGSLSVEVNDFEPDDIRKKYSYGFQEAWFNFLSVTDTEWVILIVYD